MDPHDTLIHHSLLLRPLKIPGNHRETVDVYEEKDRRLRDDLSVDQHNKDTDRQKSVTL